MTIKPQIAVPVCVALGFAVFATIIKSPEPKKGDVVVAVAKSPVLTGLEERVKDYYSKLESNKFEAVWISFIGANMQRDTSKNEYVDILNRTVGRSKLETGNPVVRIEETGTGERRHPLGKAFTRIRVITNEGEPIDATHSTIWMWQRAKDESNWVLVGDELSEAEKK